MDKEMDVGGDDDAAALMNALQLDASETHDMDEQRDALENNDVVETDEEKAKQAAEAEAKAAAEAKEAADKAASAEDEIEIPGENGAEPTRLKVSDVLAGYQQFKAIEGQQAEVVQRVERQYVEAATQRYQQVETFARESGAMIEAALQMLQPPSRPQPPNPALMNQDYARWEQEHATYQQQLWQFEQNAQRYGRAQALGRQLLERAQQAQQEATAAREDAEIARLQRSWPEFGKTEVQEKFVSDMIAAYGAHGVTKETLDGALTSHWMALVARDALAYRAMQKGGGDLKQKVETAAPKLVRSQTQAKAPGAQARDGRGQFVGAATEAKGRLAKSHSDKDALAVFAALAEAGRI